jgi:5-formyltetrahydrofolate cyclo-ligase
MRRCGESRTADVATAERAIRDHLRASDLETRQARLDVPLVRRRSRPARTFDDAWRRAQSLRAAHHAPRNGKMSFVPITPNGFQDQLVRHRGTGERSCSDQKSLRELDVVLVPTVAFDARGHRLGMGAGYYDRAMQRRRDRSRAWRRPLLVGIAFGFQEVASIDPHHGTSRST